MESMWAKPREWSMECVNDATMCFKGTSEANRIEYTLAQGIRWDNRVMAQINRATDKVAEAKRALHRKATAYGVTIDSSRLDFCINMILYVRNGKVQHKEMYA